MNEKKLSKENRKHERMPVTARVTRIDQDRKDFYFTKDLSAGGVFLEADEEIPLGTLVDLEIAIQGIKDLVKIMGRVVRIEKKDDKVVGLGVEFVDIDSKTSLNLSGFLEQETED